MSLQVFNRLEQIDYLIACKKTGKPKVLAKRVGISERTLFDFITLMKNLGAPISYCKQLKTYYYIDQGGFNVRFKRETSQEKPQIHSDLELKGMVVEMAKYDINFGSDMILMVGGI